MINTPRATITLFLLLLVFATPAGASNTLTLIIVGPDGELIPRARVGVDGGKLAETNNKAEIEVPYHGERISVDVRPPISHDGRVGPYHGNVFEVPTEILLRLKLNKLAPESFPAPPGFDRIAGYGCNPCSPCPGFCYSPCMIQCDPCRVPCYNPCYNPCRGPVVLGSPQRNAGIARINIAVPQDAVVSINGRPTKKTGTHREYISKGLKDGLAYTYVVRAQVLRDGKVVEETRKVVLRSDDNRNVAFDLSNRDTTQYALTQ